MTDKPVALINAAPPSTYAQASLAETLRTMGARLVPEASVTLPLRGKKLGAERIAADATFSAALRGAVTALVDAAAARRSRDP